MPEEYTLEEFISLLEPDEEEKEEDRIELPELPAEAEAEIARRTVPESKWDFWVEMARHVIREGKRVARNKQQLEPADRTLLGEAGVGLARGAISIAETGGGLSQLAGAALERAVDDNRVSKFLKDYGEITGGLAGTHKELFLPRSPDKGVTARRAVGVVAEGVPQFLQQVGMAYATGGASLPVALSVFAGTAGAQVVGQQYNDAIEHYKNKGLAKDKAENMAALEAGTAGLITATTSYFPAAKIFAKVPGGEKVVANVAKKAIGRVLSSGVAENLQEMTEMVLTDTVTSAYREDPAMMKKIWEGDPEYWSGVLLAGIAGFTLGSAARIPFEIGSVPQSTSRKDFEAAGYDVDRGKPAGTEKGRENIRRQIIEDGWKKLKKSADAVQAVVEEEQQAEAPSLPEIPPTETPAMTEDHKQKLPLTKNQQKMAEAHGANLEQLVTKAATRPVPTYRVKLRPKGEEIKSLNAKEARANLTKLKKFLSLVPEFAIDPVFTVNQDGQLSYKDGGNFKFARPESIGLLLPDTLKPGETVSLDLDEVKKAKIKGMKEEGVYLVGEEAEADIGATPEMTAAHEAQLEADAIPALEPRAAGLALPGFRRPAVGGGVPQQIQSRNPETERRLQASYGRKAPTTIDRVVEVATAAGHAATRTQIYLPGTEQFDFAREWFRLGKELSKNAKDDALRMIDSIIHGLDKEQYQLFERKLVADNAKASRERGEPLRHWDNDADLAADSANLDWLTDQTPSAQRARAIRTRVLTEHVRNLVNENLLPEDAIANVHDYLHQDVISYQKLMPKAGTVRKIVRAFQRKRVKAEALPEEYDYNTNYIEAEALWLTESLIELQKARRLKELMDHYDAMPRVKRNVKHDNFSAALEDPKKISRVPNAETGEDVARYIYDLRAERRALREGEDVGEADVRRRLGEISEELQELDPTHEARNLIAVGLSGLGRTEVDLELDPESPEFWKIAQLAEMQVEAGHELEKPIISARTYLKGVNLRDKIIQDLAGDNFRTPSDYLAEGMVEWQPQPGNYFYPATTLAEKIVELLEKKIIDTATISKENLKTVIAIGAKRPAAIIPAELAAQLDLMDKKPSKSLAAETLEEASRFLVTTWKVVFTLLSPKRFLPYNIRNVSGDIEPVLGTQPGLLWKSGEAFKELWRYHHGYLALTEDLREARDLGVIGSSFVAQELPEIKAEEAFKRFYDSPKSFWSMPWRAGKGYYKTARKLTEFRENVLRYAAYKHYKEKLKKKELEHYGGANKRVVDNLAEDMGDEVAAAHLSRNLIGDYGNLTVMGEWLRRHLIPFWSFQEINLKRKPRLFINAVEYGKLKGKGNKAAVAVYSLSATIALARLYAMMQLWNHLMYPDIEDELTKDDRSSPHINLGYNPDGSARIFRNVGAWGDFAEWFGINTFISLLPQYMDDQITGKDLAAEMAKDPYNKLVQGLRPDMKSFFELNAGKSTYPDATRWRELPRGEIVSNVFGLRDEYLWLKGKALEDGTRARPNYLQRYVVGVVNPKRNALYDIYDLRGKYLKKIGEERPFFDTISPFRPLRESAMNEDYEAFKEARRAYIASGKTYDNFKASLKHLDPIAMRLNDEQERQFETEFLTSIQRDKLKVARDYAQDLRVLLWKWWNDAVEDEKMPATYKAHLEELRKDRNRLILKIRSPSSTKKEWEALAVELARYNVTTRAQVVEAFEDAWKQAGYKRNSKAYRKSKNTLIERLGLEVYPQD